MAYNNTYDATDISSIAIDFVGKYGVQLVTFAGLIALVFLYAYFRSHWGKVTK